MKTFFFPLVSKHHRMTTILTERSKAWKQNLQHATSTVNQIRENITRSLAVFQIHDLNTSVRFQFPQTVSGSQSSKSFFFFFVFPRYSVGRASAVISDYKVLSSFLSLLICSLFCSHFCSHFCFPYVWDADVWSDYISIFTLSWSLLFPFWFLPHQRAQTLRQNYLWHVLNQIPRPSQGLVSERSSLEFSLN